MTTDKKCCENCDRDKPCNFHPIENCLMWQRNSDIWLDLAPEEEGWYWWKPHNDKFDIEAVKIFMLEEKLWANILLRQKQKLLITLGGQWQGPIRQRRMNEKRT